MKLIALTALSALLLLPAAQARPLAQIKSSGVIRVGTPGDIPPFAMAIPGGGYAGFEVELIQAVAADMGVKVEFVPARIDQLTSFLKDDKIDVAVSSLGITSTRENKVDFTAPTACAGVSVVSLDPNLNKHTDLKDRKIGVIAGSIFTSYLQKLPFDKKVQVYPNNNDVVIAVFTKAVDATLVWTASEPVVKKLYPKAPIHFGPSLWSVPIGMMVAQNNTLTRLTINAALARAMNNGAYAALSKKYFGQDIRCKS